MSTSISFDNIEILKFDPTKSKSATTVEYIQNIFGSNNLYFDQKNVGIGVTTPLETLDVSGVIQTNFVKTDGLTVRNNLYTESQDAFVTIRVGDRNAGNPYLSFNVAEELGGQWSFGIDNSDNKLKWKNIQDFSGPSRLVLDQQGFLGVGGVENPTAEISLPSSNKNRKILLYDLANNAHQFSGFGSSQTELRYQVGGVGIDHVFYSGVNSSSSKELLRIKGDGRLGLGGGSGSTSIKGKLSVGVDLTENLWGMEMISQDNNSFGSGVLLTNNGVGGRSFGVVSSSGKLNFMDLASTNTNFLTLDQFGGMELKNNTRTHLFVNGSNGNVGIGTSTPSFLLDVNAPARVQNNLFVGNGTSAVGVRLWDISGASWTMTTGGYNLTFSNGTIGGSLTPKVKIDQEGTVEVEKNINVKGKVQENGGDLLPAGTILPFAGRDNAIPLGFILCDGRNLNEIDYPNLFTVIGTTYGGNSVNRTFKVPDLRCRFPLGSGVGVSGVNNLELPPGSTGATNDVPSTKILGTKEGFEKVQLRTTNMPSHKHTATCGDANFSNQPSFSSGEWGGGQSNNKRPIWAGDASRGITNFGIANVGHTHNITLSDTGSNEPHNNMPPYLVINYIIKF
jgi:microcystin-dependent protein